MSGMSIRYRFVRGLAVCGLAAASLLVTQPASAQFGAMGGSDDVFRPEYTTRDVVLFVENLELDEQQRYIFETLFEMYQMDFDAGVEEVRMKLTNMRDDLVGGDPEKMLEKIFAPIDEWRKKKAVLNSRLVLDLQAQLSPQQMDKWPAFDRKLRRIKTLKDGVLTGENIDIFFVLTQMDLSKPQQDQIQPILDKYEVDLDAALVARNDFVASTQDELSQAIRDQDVERAKTIVEQQVNYRLTVRNTTETTLTELMAALPEDIAQQLRQASLEQAYGNVFRPTQMQRIFDQVLKMEELPEETMTAVKDLETRYHGDLAMINDRLVEVIRKQDGVKAVERVERLVHRVSGQTVELRQDPVREEFGNREDLDREYLKQLRALLDDNQFAAIPGIDKMESGVRNTQNTGRLGTHPSREGRAAELKASARRRPGSGNMNAANSNLGNAPDEGSGKEAPEAPKSGEEGGRGGAGSGGSGGRGGSGGSSGGSSGASGGSGGGSPR